jgi:protein tyrosine phosphatase (PTP) superfamily phosphohydrolase (DUF442 family)
MSAMLTVALLASVAVASTPAASARSMPAGSLKGAAVPSGPLADSATVMALLDGVLNRACPSPGLAIGGQPSAGHVRALAQAGFHVVVDTRGADESRGFDEGAELASAGMQYVRIPITSLASLDDATFRSFRDVMQRHGPSGVFVHCASGNRIGPLVVVWLTLD